MMLVAVKEQLTVIASHLLKGSRFAVKHRDKVYVSPGMHSLMQDALHDSQESMHLLRRIGYVEIAGFEEFPWREFALVRSGVKQPKTGQNLAKLFGYC